MTYKFLICETHLPMFNTILPMFNINLSMFNTDLSVLHQKIKRGNKNTIQNLAYFD